MPRVSASPSRSGLASQPAGFAQRGQCAVELRPVRAGVARLGGESFASGPRPDSPCALRSVEDCGCPQDQVVGQGAHVPLGARIGRPTGRLGRSPRCPRPRPPRRSSRRACSYQGPNRQRVMRVLKKREAILGAMAPPPWAPASARPRPRLPVRAGQPPSRADLAPFVDYLDGPLGPARPAAREQSILPRPLEPRLRRRARRMHGVDRTVFTRRLGGAGQALGVRFRPGRLPAVLRCSGRTLNDRVVPAWPCSARRRTDVRGGHDHRRRRRDDRAGSGSLARRRVAADPLAARVADVVTRFTGDPGLRGWRGRRRARDTGTAAPADVRRLCRRLAQVGDAPHPPARGRAARRGWRRRGLAGLGRRSGYADQAHLAQGFHRHARRAAHPVRGALGLRPTPTSMSMLPRSSGGPHRLVRTPLRQVDKARLEEVDAVEEPRDLVAAAQLPAAKALPQHLGVHQGLRGGVAEVGGSCRCLGPAPPPCTGRCCRTGPPRRAGGGSRR